MLRTKTFMAKTRKGNLVKVVKEHYLRDDIGCGSLICTACATTSNQASQGNKGRPQAILSEYPRSTSLFPRPHYLVPDTNVLLHHMVVFEHPSFHDVIILQTVLDELKNLRKSCYDRIRTLIRDDARRFYVFSNEYHHSTYIERKPNETTNDRNDRAIRNAVKWYNEHLHKEIKKVNAPPESDGKRQAIDTIDVIYISKDKESLNLAKQNEVLPACTLQEYVNGLYSEYPELVEMVVTQTQTEALSVMDNLEPFPDYVSNEEARIGVRDGSLVQGSLHLSVYNRKEGCVKVIKNGSSFHVLVSGRQNINRAIHGDLVAVRLLPEKEWVNSDNRFMEGVEEYQTCGTLSQISTDENLDSKDWKRMEDDETETQNPLSELSCASSRIFGKHGQETNEIKGLSTSLMRKHPCGQIMAIIQRRWRAYCGSLDKSKISTIRNDSKQWEHVLFLPANRHIPKIRIRTLQLDRLIGQRFVVAIDEWERTSRYPQGHFVRLLGPTGDRRTETDLLLLEHEIPDRPFMATVNACLPRANWHVTEELLLDPTQRWDLRHLDICSVDPPGCTDIDDALHATTLPNGHYEVGVHIADVSFFVRPATQLDQEANDRGTTIYLVDKRIDMLPPLLGSDLCSLRANIDRLAFSCIWEMTKDAQVVSVRINKSIIRSRASLTYEEAQRRIDNQEECTEPLTNSLRILMELSKHLRQRRIEHGALILASPEVRFRLDFDSQDPIDIEMKELYESNAMVEEFMLLANGTVAERVLGHFPNTALLRHHPAPSLESFEMLSNILERRIGVKLDVSTPHALASSLDRAISAEDPYLNKLIRIMATRCMTQAVYFCSGTMPFQRYYHFGLAIPLYTHFTSPIRRYADLIVHRLLAVSLGLQGSDQGIPTSFNQEYLKALCEVINHRHHQGQLAARDSVELFTMLFFKDHSRTLNEEEEAYVVRILQHGLVVFIPRYGLDGFLRFDENIVKHVDSTSITIRWPPVTESQTFDDILSHQACIAVLDKVLVRVSVDDNNMLRQRLQVKLVRLSLNTIKCE